MPADLSYNEKALLTNIAAGDKDAFKQLYDRYWNDIYYVALSFLKSPEWAQDIIQDVFLKIWQKRASLTSIQQFKSYIFIIARNELISALRQKMRTDIQQNQYRQIAIPESTHDTDQALAVRELETQIKTAVRQLPEQQQRIFHLARQEGLNHDEIAAQLGIARKTVANNVTKTLNHIRDYLLEHGNDVLTVALYLCLLRH